MRETDSKHRFAKTRVLGIGTNDAISAIRANGRENKAYSVWVSMLNRCYSHKYHARNPAYMGCEVCEEWKTFSSFEEWFNHNYRDGYALDKDILFPGNKLYSPKTCVFVPRKINNLLEKSTRTRGKYPIGVARYPHGFRATVSYDNKAKHIGVFDNPMDAFSAYKKAKEEIIKEVAQEYFDANKIERRVYDALMNYKVEITD